MYVSYLLMQGQIKPEDSSKLVAKKGTQKEAFYKGKSLFIVLVGPDSISFFFCSICFLEISVINTINTHY